MGRPTGSRDSYQRGRRQKTTQAKEATAKKAMARSVAVKGTRRGATNASRLLMQAFVKNGNAGGLTDDQTAQAFLPGTEEPADASLLGPENSDSFLSDDSDDESYRSGSDSSDDEREPRRYNQEIEDALGLLLNMKDKERKSKIKRQLRVSPWLHVPPQPRNGTMVS